MTDLEVANFALGLLGQYKIDSYPDNPISPTVYGQALEMYLPFAINDLMIDGEWNFARQRITLDPIAGAKPGFGYSNAFSLPLQFISLISINGEPWENQIQFAQIEGDYIFANSDQLNVVYIEDISNKNTTQEFPDILKPLLGIRWAYHSCIRITNNIDLYNMLGDAYMRELSRMRENDARNNTGGRYNYVNKLMRQATWGRYPYGTTLPFGGHNRNF